MTFTTEIEPVVNPIYDAIFEHPMVQGIGDGTLAEDKFVYWVKQDYYYLIEYARVFALATASAPLVEDMGTWARLLDETIHTEMDLHRGYAAEFGISEAELDATKPSPTTRAYTDFLVRVASTGTLADTVAVLLPCMWGFNDTGQRLAAEGVPDHEQYRAWIEMYSSEEFTELTEWCLAEMDELETQENHDRLVDLIRTSARYEYLFWDAAWQQQTWPV